MGSLIWILLILGIVVFAFMAIQGANSKQVDPALELDDAKADARQSIERLGGQVYMLSGSNPAATQALADAGERYTAAGAQIDQASSPPRRASRSRPPWKACTTCGRHGKRWTWIRVRPCRVWTASPVPAR